MANSVDPLFNKRRQLDRRGKRAPIQWRHKLTPKDYDIEKDWKEEPEETPQEEQSPQGPQKKKLGILWAFFGVAALFFLGALVFAYFSFTQGRIGVRADAILITTDHSVSIASGELVEIDFTIQNTNQIPIEFTELVLEYPEGTSAETSLTDTLRRKRVPLGDIQPGQFVQHQEAVRFFGENDQRLMVDASFEYRVPSSSAVFEIPIEIEIGLTSAPVRITVDALESLTAGQSITFDLTVESNAAERLENIIVTAEYPFGFSYVDSDFDPIFRDNVWKIDSLEPNEVKEFQVTGTLAGQNDEERRFHFETGLEDLEQNYVIGVAFSDLEHFVRISKPFLDFDITFQGETGEVFVRKATEVLAGEVILRNTTNQPIRDAEVRLTLNEPIYDKFNVNAANGFFDSTTGTLRWNEQTLEQLSFIAPGEVRRLSFEAKLLSSVKEDGSINKNPELTLNAKISGERSNEQGADEEINTNVLKKVILQTVPILRVESIAKSSKFSNSGPLPPKIETETTYEVAYDLRNSSSDIQNGQVKTALPQYASWKGVVSPGDANITYNDITREIIWNVGEVPAGTGYVSGPIQVSFQIGITPSANQVGDVLNIIEKSDFIGYDTYTETNVTTTGATESGTTPTTKAKDVDEATQSRVSI